ncbi:hypothetical protein V6x_19890 [Gimesia chilikensis]|uniref:DUF1552 domain-containing protein n=1 Tax=Gimesia chilikensis TaxID=2605989 RepID=A0A517WAL1_9PLAN|nr:DUF1552 domain-containing protein [Gimesia chilikensis]QDU02287.1 hypothetical protein V6x_19890 [Gimesia chilikensis]
MMMKTSRRSFLRGAAGATLALPWLESLARSEDPPQPAQRLAVFYVPIGVVRRGFFPGEHNAAIPKFTSSQEEITRETGLKVGMRPLQELTPTQQPLEKVKQKVTLITGMDRFYKHGSDVHAQCASCFLSSATAHAVKSSVYPLARTFDHIIADHVGEKTPFRTLELSCNSHRDNKESIYFDNISWYGTGHVAPSMRDPRKVYRRMFGTQENQAFRDITGLVLEDARSLNRRLGRADREKFAEYFDGIRTIEEQMDKLDQIKHEIGKASVKEPDNSQLPRGQYIRLMGDLMVAALQVGLTNVATLMIGPERWDTPMRYESLFDKPMSHHQMSHNQNKYMKELLQVDRFHMEQFVYLVEKMDAIREANGTTLLDNTIFTYGSGLGDGATHQYTDLPIVVAGSGGGQLKTGQHLHCSDGTALANLWLTHAHVMGLKLNRFADSTGPVQQLLT